MSGDTITLQSNPDSSVMSAVVTEFLEILGLDGDATAATPSGYGKGLAKKGFAAYAKTAIPNGLQNLVDADPPRMIGADAWEKLLEEQQAKAQAAYSRLLADKNAVAELKRELSEKIEASEQWPSGKAAGKEQAKQLQEAAIQASKEMFAIETKLQEASAKLEMSRERATLALPLIDDPRNNPERKVVTQALRQFEITSAAGGSPKEKAAAQFKDLAVLQRTLFAWNDRRARQNLPPSAEAIALGDLVQKMQRDVVKGIVERKEELPLPANVTEPYAGQARQAWMNVIASGGASWQPSEGNRIAVPFPRDGQGLIGAGGMESSQKLNAEQGKQFRIEILSDFALLLQAPAGRSLVQQLNQAKHKVSIKPGREPEHMYDKPASGAYKRAGEGESSTALIPPGNKDSDLMLGAEGGNVLTAPSFVVMGHELIHALHSSRGKSHKGESTDAIPAEDVKKWKAGGVAKMSDWTDMEEYNTIFKGKLSEQTLRAQLRLSAERYGHASPKPGDNVKGAFEEAIKDYEEVGADPTKLDAAIRARKLDPAALTDHQKLEVLKASVTGPLPPGWPASQLSVAQIEAVAMNKLDFSSFQRLGWSPFDLDDKTIVHYVKQEAYHDRSPTGLAYRALGGDQAFAALDTFYKATHTAMPSAPSGELAAPFTRVGTQGKLTALTQAQKVLDKFLNDAKDELDPTMRDKALASGKLSKRLKFAEGAYTIAASGVIRSFEPTMLDARLEGEKVNERDSVQLMLAAMKRVGERLKLDEQGHAADADIDGAIKEARSAVLACQQAKAGMLSRNKETENRQAICADFIKYLQNLDGRVTAVRQRITAGLNRILAAEGYTADDIETLEAFSATPLIDQHLHKRIENTLEAAKKWVAKGQK